MGKRIQEITLRDGIGKLMKGKQVTACITKQTHNKIKIKASNVNWLRANCLRSDTVPGAMVRESRHVVKLLL